ncbi:MAG TPA: rRNA maturation RNase YbeY [Anaerolineaceae bacterium]|nr:rRNA maturation RNase YbeY [Anaerolineaceae bacterium]
MITVEISDTFQEMVDPAWLEEAAQAALSEEEAPESSELSIVIGDDEMLQTLNLQYLGINSPTDVLSFPSEEKDPESGNLYLGDIILSYPRASEQAEAGGHPVKAELQLLVIHGVLHLLGYDHSEVEERELMWGKQASILIALGSPITGPANE